MLPANQQHPLVYLHSLDAQFIFIHKGRDRKPAHYWRDKEHKYIPTLEDINNYIGGHNVILPMGKSQEPKAFKSEHLSIAFVPRSLQILAIDVDDPEYTSQIQNKIGHPITSISTPSGGYHLFYKLPEEITNVYAKPYSLPDIPFSIGEIRVNGYCIIYDPHGIAYAAQEVQKTSLPYPPLNQWPLDSLLKPPATGTHSLPTRDYSANTDPQDEETVVMLSYIHSESYEDFFRVLMALKAGQDSGELIDAYSVAQHWVQSGNVPDGRRMTSVQGLEHIWKTEPDGNSTMATITYLANESGYIPSSANTLDVDIVVPEGGAAALTHTLNGGTVGSSPASQRSATLPIASPMYASSQKDTTQDPSPDDPSQIINVPDQGAAPLDKSMSTAAAPPGRPTKRTGNNLRNQLRTLMFNLALENDLPKHLRFDDSTLVDCDVERILKYCTDQLFIMNNNIYISHKQLWRLMRIRDDETSVALVRGLVVKGREFAYADLPNEFYDNKSGLGEVGESIYGDQLIDSPTDFRHIDMVAKTLAISVYDPRIPIIRSGKVDNRDKYPLLPFTDGTSMDLRSKMILSSEQVRPLLLLDHDWVIPPPLPLQGLLNQADEMNKNAVQHDWDVVQAHLNGRYSNIIDRISMYACGTTKSIDVISLPTDGGKSALIDALGETFGEDTFIAVTAKKTFGAGNRFAPLPWYLANAMGVFVIELHGEEIKSADMNIWVETTQEFERKGVNIKRAPRIGTVMIVGDEEPINFSSDSQGWKTRVKWVENRLEERPMSGADYMSMQSEAGVHCLLNHFINCAYARFQAEDQQWKIRSTQERERSGDVDWLQSEARDPIILALLKLIEPADSLSYIPTSNIVKVLKVFAKKNEEFGLDSKKIPTTRQINGVFKKAFPCIEQTGMAPKPKQKKYEGENTRGYEYFKFTVTGIELLQDT